MLFQDGGNPGDPVGTPYPDATRATRGCHDITVFPSKKLAAGACMGDGVLWDLSNPAVFREIDRVQDDANFAFWHSATFNNDGTKLVFTDELGGGGAATCVPEIPSTRGADGIYDIEGKGLNRELVFKSYYKIPRLNTEDENCVAHNGSLIPVPGRDIMVQSWYMGGISVWDFTDSANPVELGYWERGPVAGGRRHRRRHLVRLLVQRQDLQLRPGQGLRRPEDHRGAVQPGQQGQVRRAERPDPAGVRGAVTALLQRTTRAPAHQRRGPLCRRRRRGPRAVPGCRLTPRTCPGCQVSPHPGSSGSVLPTRRRVLVAVVSAGRPLRTRRVR